MGGDKRGARRCGGEFMGRKLVSGWLGLVGDVGWLKGDLGVRLKGETMLGLRGEEGIEDSAFPKINAVSVKLRW